LPLWQWTTTEKEFFFFFFLLLQQIKNRSTPVQGISWRELQVAIFATSHSRQYRSCMEMTYITTRKEKNENINKQDVKTTFDKRRPDCHYTGLSCGVDNLILIGDN
jgi:hypothetical protein